MWVTKGARMSHHGPKQNSPYTLAPLFRNYEASSSPRRQVFVTWNRFSLQGARSGRRAIAEDYEADGKRCFRCSEALKILRDVALASDAVPAWPFRDEPLREQRNQIEVPRKGFNDEAAGHGFLLPHVLVRCAKTASRLWPRMDEV